MKKKSKNPIIIFPKTEDPDENGLFVKLMKSDQVKPIINLKDTKSIREKKPVEQDPVSFQNDAIELQQTYHIDINKKYAGLNRKKRKRAYSPRKPKIKPTLEPDATLDLHGETEQSALTKTNRFIRSSQQKNLRIILIITGKGLHSGQKGSVVNKAILNWLSVHQRELSIRYRKAPAFLGGSGAVLVML